MLCGGAFLFVYLVMWALIPTAGSIATEPNRVIQENINEMGEKVRSFIGGGTGNTGVANTQAQANPGTPGGNGGPGAANANPNSASTQAQAQTTQTGSTAQTQWRQGINPKALILVGLFFLLANLGVFHAIHWGMWWPLLLIGLGVIMLSHQNRP